MEINEFTKSELDTIKRLRNMKMTEEEWIKIGRMKSRVNTVIRKLEDILVETVKIEETYKQELKDSLEYGFKNRHLLMTWVIAKQTSEAKKAMEEIKRGF